MLSQQGVMLEVCSQEHRGMHSTACKYPCMAGGTYSQSVSQAGRQSGGQCVCRTVDFECFSIGHVQHGSLVGITCGLTITSVTVPCC